VARTDTRYIPALRFRILMPLYDPLLKWGMREEAFKRRLIARAAIEPGQDVLDLGCGTGTLTLMLKDAVPAARVTGLDGDVEVLNVARTKAARSGHTIQWDLGMAYDLPYPERSFDVVVSSLVIHHLHADDKLRAFREVRRILRPGGAFHIVDFGPPVGWLTRVQTSLMKHLEQSADNFEGRIVGMLEEAGFSGVAVTDPMCTIFGPVWFYDGLKPKG